MAATVLAPLSIHLHHSLRADRCPAPIWPSICSNCNQKNFTAFFSTFLAAPGMQDSHFHDTFLANPTRPCAIIFRCAVFIPELCILVSHELSPFYLFRALWNCAFSAWCLVKVFNLREWYQLFSRVFRCPVGPAQSLSLHRNPSPPWLPET